MLFLISLLLTSQIELKLENMLSISLENYAKNFVFIVNDKEYLTSRIIADILSPKIYKMHITEPKINSFVINTQISGNFSYFLQLIKFDSINIPENEILFINEVATILDNQFIVIKEQELTIDNVIEKLKKHAEYPDIFYKQIEEEIEFLATNFYLIDNTQESSLYALKKFILDKIFTNAELCLSNEDQLLKIINTLYNNNSNYSYMYEYIDFNKVSDEGISDFLHVYNYNDLTSNVWQSFSSRIKHFDNENISIRHKYYVKAFLYHKNRESQGIISYLKEHSNKIEDEIRITQTFVEDGFPKERDWYPDSEKDYKTINLNQYICIEFKKHSIIPTSYILRKKESNNDISYLYIEGSYNNKDWFLIDEKYNDWYYFNLYGTAINSQMQQKIKYFRIHIKGNEWKISNILNWLDIEIYGYLL